MESRPHLVPCIASALLLVAALGQHPYGYYTFMRWVVLVSACLVAWVAWDSGTWWVAYVFGTTAILFNPLAPITMSRDQWAPIDIIVALAFIAAIALRRPTGQRVGDWPASGA